MPEIYPGGDSQSSYQNEGLADRDLANDKIQILRDATTIKGLEPVIKNVLILTTPNKGASLFATNSMISDLKNSIGRVVNISNAFNFGNLTIRLAENVTLNFEKNGSFKNVTLVGNNSTIIANNKIFDNVTLEGTWRCQGLVKWFTNTCELHDFEVNSENGLGNKYTGIRKRVDCTSELQEALDSPFKELVFTPGVYYVSDTLVLSKEKKLILQGESKLGLEMCSRQIKNGCYIFTDLNITLLRIAVVNDDISYLNSYTGINNGLTVINEYENTTQNTVSIIGGNFDVSLCDNYTSNCIEVVSDNREKIWGLNINTNIIGKSCGSGYNSDSNPIDSVGIYINPNVDTNDYSNTVGNTTTFRSFGFVTQIKINSNISYFRTGIKAQNYTKNWCTDLRIDGSIINCITAVESNVENTYIGGLIQAGYFFNLREPNGINSNNTIALIRVYDTDKIIIAASIYDIKIKPGVDKWSNYYVLDISGLNDGYVLPCDNFKIFYEISKRIKNNSIDPNNGKIISSSYQGPNDQHVGPIVDELYSSRIIDSIIS